MKPVFQRVIDQERGDCWRCCIASILELDAEDVPNFRETEQDNMDAIEEWCASAGVALVEIGPRWASGAGVPADRLVRYDWARGVYAIASVPSQRFPGGMHAVVVQFADHPDHPGVAVKVVVAHDPNPGNGPYDDETIAKVGDLVFVVPYVPRAVRPTVTP